jgi:hypothetical protein
VLIGSMTLEFADAVVCILLPARWGRHRPQTTLLTSKEGERLVPDRPSCPITRHEGLLEDFVRNGRALLLPAAHDALTARVITRAGFKAFQVGGFALAGARYAYPDIDLVQFYEE